MARSSVYDARRRVRNRRAVAEFQAAQRAGPAPDAGFWLSPAFLQGQPTLKQPYKQHPWVYRAVTVISQNLASVPFRLYSGDPAEPTEVTDNDWNRLFLNPNLELTARQHWTQTWLNLLARGGQCFWLLEGASGPVSEYEIPRWMWPYPGSMFEPKVNERTGLLEGWKMNRGGKSIALELFQVVQVRLEDPYDTRGGLSPYDAAERSVRTDVKAHQWNEAGLDNGAVPGGVLEGKDGNVSITAEHATSIRRQIEDRHMGASKAGKLMVLPAGLQWKQTGMTPKDMEFAGQREWSRQEISSVYGVPQFLLGILGDVHRETSREARKLFWEETLVPLLAVAQDILRARLFMGRGDNPRVATEMPRIWGAFDLSGVQALQADETERVDRAGKLWTQGVSLAELNRRYELGLEEQEGWDTSFVPLGVEPVEQATAKPQPIPDFFGGPPAEEEEDDEDDQDDDDRTLHIKTAKRGDVERRVLWEQYIRGIQQPGEKRMQSRVLGWIRKVRKSVLRFLAGERAVRQLSEGEVDAFIAGHADQWTQELIATTQPVTEWIVDMSLDRLAGQVGALSHASMTHPAILEFLNVEALSKSKIASTVTKQLRLSLIEGLAEGQSVGASQAALQEILERETNLTMRAARNRSLTIARTESGSASTGSRYEAYRIEGVGEHSWLTAGDGKERASHAAQDGVVRAIGDTFPNGLRYPLDTQGSAGEVINCRCDTLPE